MKILKLFLALILASALTCSFAYAKQESSKHKHAKAKSKASSSTAKQIVYRLKPASARVKNFFLGAYNVLRQMGYSKTQSLNGAFCFTLHCWRESNMHGAGVAKWLYQKHGAINPGHITVPAEWKGIWKYEWDNGVRVRKKWAAWTTYEDAARGTIEYIKRNNPRAFNAALRGDINAYASAVSNSNYHTGDAKEYKSVLLDCVPTIKRMLE